MATFIPEINAIYLAAPGTGSTSVERMCLDFLKGTYIEAPAQHFIFGTRHALKNELIHGFEKGFIPPIDGLDIHNTVFFTTVRNPYAYYYSDWYRNRTKWIKELLDKDSWVYAQPNKIQQIVKSVILDFPEWLEDALGDKMKNGVQYHLNEPYVEASEYFIRTEHIFTDFKAMLDDLGCKTEIKEIRLNETEKANGESEYWRHYSKRAREIIDFVHRPTIDKFGFTL